MQSSIRLVSEMVIEMKQDCCFCFFVHYKLREMHFILFFLYKKIHCVSLHTSTTRKAGEAGFQLQCVPLEANKTSGSKNIKNASSEHFANTEWCLHETFSLKLQIKKYFFTFLFSLLFLLGLYLLAKGT